jgi:hypothetical protein
MKSTNSLPDLIQILLLDPNAVTAPVDLVIERQDAIRIDEDRNASTRKGLVEAIGKVSTSTGAEDVIAIDEVSDKFHTSVSSAVLRLLSGQSAPKTITKNKVALHALRFCQPKKGDLSHGGWG